MVFHVVNELALRCFTVAEGVGWRWKRRGRRRTLCRIFVLLVRHINDVLGVNRGKKRHPLASLRFTVVRDNYLLGFSFL